MTEEEFINAVVQAASHREPNSQTLWREVMRVVARGIAGGIALPGGMAATETVPLSIQVDSYRDLIALDKLKEERDIWRSTAESLRVMESRISGILCDAETVVVDPLPDGVARLVAERNLAQSELAKASIALSSAQATIAELNRLCEETARRAEDAASQCGIYRKQVEDRDARIRELEVELASLRMGGAA
jgi:hypothetical protein